MNLDVITAEVEARMRLAGRPALYIEHLRHLVAEVVDVAFPREPEPVAAAEAPMVEEPAPEQPALPADGGA